MFAILHATAILIANRSKSRRRLETENILLRQQLNVTLRQAPMRRRLRGIDRAILAWMVRVWPDLVGPGQLASEARDGSPLAMGGFHGLLALEIPMGAGQRRYTRNQLKMTVYSSVSLVCISE
jgi:hypothetical protein